jgi:bifunctional DNA-binding transcriptional regulator/antitoxin component of YhaV-PrlF toxin-antitoxin module
MKTIKITDMASVIRSKNSGPYELTFDIIFKSRDYYEHARRSGVLNKERITELYHLGKDGVLGTVWFDAALAFKATIVRPLVSGDPGETDVYGAQQHAPLLLLSIPVDIRERLRIGEDTLLEVFQVGKAIVATPVRLTVKELTVSVQKEMAKNKIDLEQLLAELREARHEYETE